MKTNKLGNNSFVLSLNARMYVYTTKAKKQIQFHSYVVPYDGSCQPDTWRASCIKNVFWLVCLVSFTIFSLWPKLLFIERLLFTPKSFRKTKRGWYYFTLARICFSFYQYIGRMFERLLKATYNWEWTPFCIEQCICGDVRLVELPLYGWKKKWLGVKKS